MSRTGWRWLLAVWLALLLAACGGGSSDEGGSGPPPGIVEGPFPPMQVEPLAFTGPDVLLQQPSYGWGVRPVPQRVRAATSPAKSAAAQRTTSVVGRGAPMQVGEPRDLPASGDAAAMRGLLQWQQGAAGSAAAVTFSSDGASAIRLGLLVHRIPAGAAVRIYQQGQPTAYETFGDAISAGIEANRAAGDLSDDSRMVWLPAVDGVELTLEIQLPPGAAPQTDLDFFVPMLSHLDVRTSELQALKIGESGACNVDVSCVPGADNLSRATARMVFTEGGFSYLCSGTLMNDAAADGIPYFLSAYHCISSQTAASSLVTYWFYRSGSCNSGGLNPAYRSLASGATLLYASETTDTSFMRLNAMPPPGVVYAPWSSTLPGLGTDVVGIHHPSGDLQKFSQGQVSGYQQCTTSDATGAFGCSPSTPTAASDIAVRWGVGTTEGGSSGSGLFAAIGGGRYLVGQLHGGTSSCAFRAGEDLYGRFDQPYFEGLGRWLSPPAAPGARAPLYRFYNRVNGSHFYTLSPQERDRVSTMPDFTFEGVGFYVYAGPVSGAVPVYRLFNTLSGRHLYTASAAERDRVVATQPGYVFEGIAWHAQLVDGGSAVPVYRFYNRFTTAHFYTASEQEKNRIVATDPTLMLEGVAYFAWITQ